MRPAWAAEFAATVAVAESGASVWMCRCAVTHITWVWLFPGLKECGRSGVELQGGTRCLDRLVVRAHRRRLRATSCHLAACSQQLQEVLASVGVEAEGTGPQGDLPVGFSRDYVAG